MTETVPSRPFDEEEALSWLRSQPDGRVTARAAELARQWGWKRMRAGRRLKAWQEAGYIRRNAEEIKLHDVSRCSTPTNGCATCKIHIMRCDVTALAPMEKAREKSLSSHAIKYYSEKSSIVYWARRRAAI